MSTIRQVAQLAGVSVATVSGVLNKTKKVTPEVQKRVEAALQALDYRPNALARGLFSGQTQTIAFLVPSISNPPFADNLLAIERRANEKGYAVFLANTRGERELVDSYCNRLIEMHVDGVIITMTWEFEREEVVQRLLQRGIKVVGCSGSRPLEGIDCFIVDERRAGEDLGRYLLGLGHHDVAYIGPKESTVADLRFAGLASSFTAAKESVPDPLRIFTSAYNEASGEEGVRELLSRGERFSCIIAFNDLVATGVMQTLRQQGFSVPQQVSVATFGDHYARLTSPRLTTMMHNDIELGTMAIDRLLERIAGLHAHSPAVHMVKKQLVIRESTCAIRSRSATSAYPQN